MNEHYDHFAGWCGGMIATFFCGISVTALDIGFKLISLSIAAAVGGTTVWYNVVKIKQAKNKKDE